MQADEAPQAAGESSIRGEDDPERAKRGGGSGESEGSEGERDAMMGQD